MAQIQVIWLKTPSPGENWQLTAEWDDNPFGFLYSRATVDIGVCMENSGNFGGTLEKFSRAANIGLQSLQDQYTGHHTAYPVRLLSDEESMGLVQNLEETVFLSRENILSVADPYLEEQITSKVMGDPSIISVIEKITGSPALGLLSCGLSIKPTCSTRLSFWNAAPPYPQALPSYQTGYPIGLWIYLRSTEAPQMQEASEPQRKKQRTFSYSGVRRRIPNREQEETRSQDAGLLGELARCELIDEHLLSHEVIHASKSQARNEIVSVSLTPGEGIIFNCGEPSADLNSYDVSPAWGVFGFYSPVASSPHAAPIGERFLQA